jgi:DNA-binding beta-propeller fold protein YncE
LVVGRRPRALCYNPRGNKVYCANGSSNNVAVINGEDVPILELIRK